jgi:hypothetical protein
MKRAKKKSKKKKAKTKEKRKTSPFVASVFCLSFSWQRALCSPALSPLVSVQWIRRVVPVS